MVFRPAGKPKRQTFTHTCPFPCSLSCSTSFFLCHCLSHCYDATSLHFERCNVVFSRTAVYAVHECTEMHCRCARTQILFTEQFFLFFLLQLKPFSVLEEDGSIKRPAGVSWSWSVSFIFFSDLAMPCA